MKSMILFQQRLMTTIHNVCDRFTKIVQEYLDEYPYLTFFLFIIGLTLFVLTAVTLLTIIFILPISFLFGWI
ncbi:MAG: hypothetical protein RR630_04040 [Coprobacillus sp.]